MIWKLLALRRMVLETEARKYVRVSVYTVGYR